LQSLRSISLSSPTFHLFNLHNLGHPGNRYDITDLSACDGMLYPFRDIYHIKFISDMCGTIESNIDQVVVAKQRLNRRSIVDLTCSGNRIRNVTLAIKIFLSTRGYFFISTVSFFTSFLHRRFHFNRRFLRDSRRFRRGFLRALFLLNKINGNLDDLAGIN